MTDQERQRFDMLRQTACVSPDYIDGYYGLTWPLPDDVRPDYEAWARQLRRRHNCVGSTVSRYELESFMQQKNVVPKKWMAARLGMRIPSFEQLLARLNDIGMRPQRYVVYGEMIAESLSEDIVQNLPGLKFRSFSDHNSFCNRLHTDLQKVLDLNVEQLFCVTSDRLQEYPRQIGSYFDCITLEALSGKHQMWLDFRKPLNLAPDRCSKLLYTENRELLRPYCAGTQEPEDLDQYVHFLAEDRHA